MNLRAIAFAFLASLSSAHSETGLLYFTDFDEFPVGDNFWAGQHGWLSNPEATENGVQGIDEGLFIEDLDKTAFLGSKQPETRWTSVLKQINHDSETEGSAFVEVDTLIGFTASTNGHHDSFFVSVYNNEGLFLAAIQFSSDGQSFRIWRDDGTVATDTTDSFIPSELQLLVLRIDLINNLWSADYDGLPLFKDEVFTETGNARNFGLLAYEWQVTDASPAKFGNNWLLVADCSIWAIPPGKEKLELALPSFSSTGEPSLNFTGEPGWTYQIEYSEDFNDWQTDLPNSRFEVSDSPQELKFSDTSSRAPHSRYYRIQRTITP